jgi:hypothetical protein
MGNKCGDSSDNLSWRTVFYLFERANKCYKISKVSTTSLSCISVWQSSLQMQVAYVTSEFIYLM